MKKLVIVESPNKIKSIEKYLGEDYKVMASVGHIVHLPSSGVHRFGVDMETWTPNYQPDPKKKEVIAKLKKAVKEVEIVYIATDPDREGEAIGDNLVDILKLKDKYKRIRYNEITKEAVNAAMEAPSMLDEALVNSQIARRILDRIIGYKLSALMRRKISNTPNSPSAGRVQSIALKLVVLKEREIKAFVPVHYFLGNAIINEDVVAKFYNPKNEDNKEWISAEDVKMYEKDFKGPLVVTDIKTSQKNDNTRTPFKQAVLYKKADSQLGISSQSIQRAAQRLYEGYGDGGLITYPRTDSTRMSASFIVKAKQFITDKYGAEYLAEKITGFAGAQDAHEAIRPTNLNMTPEKAKGIFSLSSNEYRVYKLIYTNTIQSLMKVPRRETLRYELEVNGHNFKMTSSKIIFDGYYKASGYEAAKELPKYTIGDKVDVQEYKVEAHETKPPSRYNEGSLIEKLDSIGVGRPSTFATTINILKTRDYVTKEGKALVATDFAGIIFDKLTAAFPNIMNEEYSSELGTKLDKIAENKMDYKQLLDEFWAEFEKELEEATETLEVTKMLSIPAGKDCPKCGEPLIVRRNKKDNTKFFGCSNFPECVHTESDPNQKRTFFGKKKWTKK